MDIFYCHWELAALKEDNAFMGSLRGSVVAVNLVFATHKRERLIATKSLSLSFSLSDLTPQTWEPKATWMGNSFGEVESERLGQSDSVSRVLWTGCLVFEAEMILEGWRKAEQLSGSFFPKFPFLGFRLGFQNASYFTITAPKSEEVQEWTLCSVFQ